MPENEFNERFFEQFPDDYFAESDEHLRSFHTLKGISAIANVTAAETLARHMENYLRILRDRPSALSEEGLHALIDSTHRLEETVAARRAGDRAHRLRQRRRTKARSFGGLQRPSRQTARI